MDIENLRDLLEQNENSTLEFKREPFKIDDVDEKVRSRQRDELIKDILALANGNSIVAGDIAYLIIGAGNTKDESGLRPTYDTGEGSLSTRRILDIVNSACTPKLEDIESEIFELDGKRINIITIHPSPHLYETTRRLEPTTAKGAFTEYVVFIRHNESIRVASGKERDAIARLKRLRFNETRNPSPEPFGAIVGATIGALSLSAAAEKILGEKDGARAAGTVAGTIFGGTVGLMLGNTFKNVVEIRNTWPRLSNSGKVATVFILGVLGFIIWPILKFFTTRKERPL